MATRAILIPRIAQVVKSLRRIRCRSLTITMTFQAEQPDVAANEHAGIDRTVRDMTGKAPIRSQRDVLENEGTFFIRVTAKTKGIPTAERLHALRDIERGMLLVTVMAVHASFGNLMMKRAGEFSSNLAMAIETEARRLVAKDIRMRYLLVGIVTIVAGDGINFVLVLMEAACSRPLLLVAGNTHLRHVSCGGFSRIEDVSLSTGLDVSSPRAMTHLAAFNRRNVPWAANGSEMSRPRKPSVKLRMTRATGLRAHKIGCLVWLLCLLIISYRPISDESIRVGRDRARRFCRDRAFSKSIG